MYEAFWNLTRKPFPYHVDADQLYRTKSLQSASLRLRYCFDNNAGAALLIGESGVGKSSLLRMLRSNLKELSPYVHVTFPTLSPAELLRVIAEEMLGRRDTGAAEPGILLPRVRDYLVKNSSDGKHCVVAFDESHLLSEAALNEVVLPLLNLADTDANLQLSVILSGQPVLGSHIARNAQLRERIAVTARIDPFSAEETAEYIRSRMQDAGADRQIFGDDAIEAIVALSGGNPRRVNRLCDMALLVGSADQNQTITAADVDTLSAEILPAAA